VTGDFLVALHESRAMIAARVGLLRGSFRRTALYPFRVAHRNFPKSWKGSDKGKCKTLPTIQQVPGRRVLARQRHRIALTGIHKFCGGLGRGLPAPVALTSNRDNYPANWTRTSWPDARRQVYRISDKASSFPAMGKGGRLSTSWLSVPGCREKKEFKKGQYCPV
jgi:hypothetical protein